MFFKNFKSKKVKAVISIVSLALATTFMFTGCGNELVNDEPSTYKGEVEAYLDFIAEKNDSVSDFISDTYFMGDAFGDLYSGRKADNMLNIIFESLYDADELPSMYYGEIDYDSWQDYIEYIIDEMYDDFERSYGDDWTFKYKITGEKELSKEELAEYSFWGEFYEESLDNLDLSDSDYDDLEEFFESIEDLEISEAYVVYADIKIKGDEHSDKGNAEFVVAKLGDQWVILDGYSYYDFV